MKMRTHAKLHELPLTGIRPEGWLRCYLEKQRDGLTGYLDIAAGHPFDTPGWIFPKAKTRDRLEWWDYEQNGYWIDGVIRCGYLLRDEFLIRKAKKHIDHVLEHADSDGYLGPASLKAARYWSRWPHAVFFRAVMAHYSVTGDKRILSALTRHYLSNTSPHSHERDVCNIESILWTCERNGNRRLLEHAINAYDEYNRVSPGEDTTLKNMLSGKRGASHGVTYNEIGKLGAILYIYTGKKKYLAATINAYRKLDRDQMLIDGVCSSSEYLRGKDPLDSHETCDIADYTWSVGYLLLATGNAEYADKIERACFNAAPGAVRSDFKALQYLSCPNQVVADGNSNHNLYMRGHNWMAYKPNPDVKCCAGEVNRIMPNFAARMWLRDNNNGLVAALYGPSRVTADVGKAQRKVTIVEETNYPFSDRIDFEIRTAAPIVFTLNLRIPDWCNKPQLLLNGKAIRPALKKGAFAGIHRMFSHNDRITLILPMKIRLSHWPRGGVGIERGPLTYALGIEEDRRIDKEGTKSSKRFPAWSLYPVSRWNYALAVDKKALGDGIEIVRRPFSLDPWSIDTAPVELRVPARRVSNWRIVKRKSIVYGTHPDGSKKKKLKGSFMFTPQLPNAATLDKRLGKKVETITLVPYGCTKLRIAVFPVCN